MERWQRRDGKGLLSESQQRRYMSRGVTESQYRNKSFSLSAVRGHERTPERPERALAKPARYREYLSKPRSGGKTMLVLTTDGVEEVPHLSKTERTRVAKHWNAVRDYLASQGLDTSVLSSQGMGMDEPVADNTTSDGRQKNRRVEIIIR